MPSFDYKDSHTQNDQIYYSRVEIDLIYISTDSRILEYFYTVNEDVRFVCCSEEIKPFFLKCW